MTWRVALTGDSGTSTTRSGSGAQQSNGSAGTVIPMKKGSTSARPIQWSFMLIFAADNVPQAIPPYKVPDGCTVRARAFNGSAAGNVAAVFVATDRTALLRGQGSPLAPLDDVSFPVEKLFHAWGMGKTGDGVIFSVVSQQQ